MISLAHRSRRAWKLVLFLWLAGMTARGATTVAIHEIMYHAASHDPAEDFVEILNPGPAPVDLGGWALEGGIRYVFPAGLTLAAGELRVVAAAPDRLRSLHPGLTGVLGPYTGRLSNAGETLILRAASGATVDEVRYAQDGDWAVRIRGPEDFGHRGWDWEALHDGGGRSLELIQPGMPHGSGQNWAASQVPNGTPGRPNSVAATDLPPIVRDVRHEPVLPRPGEAVVIRVRVEDETVPESVRVWSRSEIDAGWEETVMRDDGPAPDREPGDGEFAARLTGRPAGAVVEFFVEARDVGGQVRAWPPLSRDDGVWVRSASCLYAVEEAEAGGDGARKRPTVRLVLRRSDLAVLEQINRGRPVSPIPSTDQTRSHATFDGTFIELADDQVEMRYQVGVRNRGNGSRFATPQSFRVNFPGDRTWNGVSAVNLNSQSPDIQVLGGVLFRAAGLPVGHSRPVVLRVNGTNVTLAGAIPAGLGTGHFHALNEVIDGDFARRQFPLDSGGAIYRGQRQDRPLLHAGLGDLGPDPGPYRAVYFKRTGVSEDDWSDLLELAQQMTHAPEPTYPEAIAGVVDVGEWVRYFALNTLLDNRETSPVNGHGDDYFLVRGDRDRRFRILPYDLDSLLGDAGFGGPTAVGLFPMLGGQATNFTRFITHPVIAPQFLSEIRRLGAEVFEVGRFGPLVDAVLGDWVNADRRSALKQFLDARARFLRGLIPERLTVMVNGAEIQGRAEVTGPSVLLAGVADPVRTRTVTVNGARASWNALSGSWTFQMETLPLGATAVDVRALDAAGGFVERRTLELWRDPARWVTVAGALSGAVRWSASEGPYWLTGTVTIPVGASLEIGPGTTVIAEPGARLLVQGSLQVLGAVTNRVRFASRIATESLIDGWQGIAFESAQGTNRLWAVDFNGAGSGGHSVAVTDSVLEIHDCVFAQTTRTLIETRHASVDLRRTRFPNLDRAELIHGREIPEGGFFRIVNCEFGTTTGLNDIIDFSAARRPGPILEIWDNVFLGASDDVLDLDGCDSHIEGNLFLNVTNGDASAPDTASAISFGEDGGYAPHVVAVRNVFVQVDHVALCKEGGFLTLENNTAIGVGLSAVNFSEPARGVLPGRGARLDRNIFWDCPRIWENRRPSNGSVTVTATANVASAPFEAADGEGNLVADPRFVAPEAIGLGMDIGTMTRGITLREDSPAKGIGRAGLDAGAAVGPGLSLRGPRAVEWRRSLAVQVAGAGASQYRWRLDEGPWSDAFPITTDVEISGLADGPHRLEAEAVEATVRVDGPNKAGALDWRTDPAIAGVKVTEILSLADPASSTGPFVEWWNDGPVAMDVSGWTVRLLEGAASALVMPRGTRLDAGEMRVFPFAAGGEGGTVVVADAAGVERDRRVFGRQIQGWSIAADAAGTWMLTAPNPGREGRGTDRVRLGDSSAVRIAEWLAAAGDAADDDFVELLNPGEDPVDLGGFAWTDNVAGWPDRSVLPPLTFVAPGESAVWIADGRGTPGRLRFRLDRAEGEVALLDRQGAVVDQVSYRWQRRDESEGRKPGTSDRVVRLGEPTPGAPAAAEGLVLNEVLMRPEAGLHGETSEAAWVELHNPGSMSESLAGVVLSTTQDGSTGWVLPENAQVGPGEFYVVRFDMEAEVPETWPEGGTLFLHRTASRGGGILDSVRWGPQVVGLSIGRDAANPGRWVLSRPTPGLTNAPVATSFNAGVRLNEWMADPRLGEDWIELHNPSGLPASLEGFGISDTVSDPWRYRFPPLSFLGTNLDAFLIVPGRVLGFGLNRDGERLLLSEPGRTWDEIRYGHQSPDVSEGRFPEGAELVRAFPGGPSPGAPNRWGGGLAFAEDVDADGLPDSWEIDHGLRIDPLAEDDAASGDADRDGMSNLDEWRAGTDPRDAASVLRIDGVLEDGGFQLRARIGAGRMVEWQGARPGAGPGWGTVLAGPMGQLPREHRARIPMRVPDDAQLFRVRVGAGVGR